MVFCEVFLFAIFLNPENLSLILNRHFKHVFIPVETRETIIKGPLEEQEGIGKSSS